MPDDIVVEAARYRTSVLAAHALDDPGVNKQS